MLNFHDLQLRYITEEKAYRIINKYHYSKIRPKITKICCGGYINGKLEGVLTLGWGVRPQHTIKKLFPSLSTKDYYEIGKLCLSPDLPRNSESYFISKVLKGLRQDYPHIKLIFTWADGIMGKPGYVYQASNFLYGGYIWTDVYISSKGEKIHPRAFSGIIKKHFKNSDRIRPTWEQLNYLNIGHIKGKQFRYVYFLDKSKKFLLNNSTVEWNLDFPKENDLKWKKLVDKGKWIECDKPIFSNNYTYYNLRNMSDAYSLSLF